MGIAKKECELLLEHFLLNMEKWILLGNKMNPNKELIFSMWVSFKRVLSFPLFFDNVNSISME